MKVTVLQLLERPDRIVLAPMLQAKERTQEGIELSRVPGKTVMTGFVGSVRASMGKYFSQIRFE